MSNLKPRTLGRLIGEFRDAEVGVGFLVTGKRKLRLFGVGKCEACDALTEEPNALSLCLDVPVEPEGIEALGVRRFDSRLPELVWSENVEGTTCGCA